MSSKLLKLALVGLSAAFCAAARADVTGKVTLDGTPPEMKVIDMSGVPACAACHPDPVTEETVVVSDKGELKNVVVSLKLAEDQDPPGGDAAKKPSTAPVVLDQQGCVYSPHVVAMQVGQPLVVKNSDPFMHNVHAKCTINEPFNNAQPTKNDGVKVDPQPKAAETFKINCDVHPWMAAWVAVFEHPYFAVTGDDGTYTIKNLPDGTYTLTAWQEKYGSIDQKITVKDGKAVADFKFSTNQKPTAAKVAVVVIQQPVAAAKTK